MKNHSLSILLLALLPFVSCGPGANPKAMEERHKSDSMSMRRQRMETTLAMQASANQPGMSSNSGWYCPDNVKGFPPVDVKLWNKVRVVNGRLPTFEESQDGTSLIYCDTTKTPDAKPYAMTMPKLASFYCKPTGKRETVIVIQIVQTARDTVAGYRFLTGGNGTSEFRDMHFLTDAEIKNLTGNAMWYPPAQ
jgi:hypothetical protein